MKKVSFLELHAETCANRKVYVAASPEKWKDGFFLVHSLRFEHKHHTTPFLLGNILGEGKTTYHIFDLSARFMIYANLNDAFEDTGRSNLNFAEAHEALMNGKVIAPFLKKLPSLFYMKHKNRICIVDQYSDKYNNILDSVLSNPTEKSWTLYESAEEAIDEYIKIDKKSKIKKPTDAK